MKKALVCLLFAAAFWALGQRQVWESVEQAVRQRLGSEQAQEAPEDLPVFDVPVHADATDTLDVTLYYRFGQTNVLGMERAQLETGRTQTVAGQIVERLVAGPDAAHGRLSGVFPRGTRVLSVTEEGTTVFVTLSDAFLGQPDGAPADWEDLAVWQEEATLRRYLAAQSIVCALTEGGRFQRVQLYVAGDEEDAPRRIPLVYFDLDVTDPSVVLAASSRDEAAILTPQRAMQMILDCWQRRDWEGLYALLCADEDGQMPTLSAFEAQMREADVSLLTAEVSGGTVDASGQTATLVLDGAVRAAQGGDIRLIRQSVPLVRASDNWAMRLGALLTLMNLN